MRRRETRKRQPRELRTRLQRMMMRRMARAEVVTSLVSRGPSSPLASSPSMLRSGSVTRPQLRVYCVSLALTYF